MATILNTIADYAKKRVEASKSLCPLNEIKAQALAMDANTGFPFENALKKDGISFICEVKKASPSKGIIAEDFPYLDIAREYEKAGASCLSVLTEPKWFLGKNEYLKEIHEVVKLPLLRKDFTVDPYMIYEAKVIGASAILLICSLLNKDELAEYAQIARELGLSCLVETHDEQEVEMAVASGAGVIGVNNRNLKDFTVDIHNSERLRALVPKDRVFVSESGIKTPMDIKRLYDNGTDAVLIGETFMRSPDKKAALDNLKSLI